MWTFYISGVIFTAGLLCGKHEQMGYPFWKILVGGLLWGLIWPFLLIRRLLTGKGE